MKFVPLVAVLLLASMTATPKIVAQDDEIRQATGLPMIIGENAARGNTMNVSGRIKLEGIEKLKRMPIIMVTVSYAGATVDRAAANDSGYYLVRNVPRDRISVLVEVDGIEVVRQPILSSPMGNTRFDLTVPWPSARTAKPGVISAGQSFSRTEKNEELFQKAVMATKARQAGKAVEFFNLVLKSEPKDFVAWTELGTLYFKENSLDNAEACYFKAIELKKDYFVALLNWGKLYLTRKQYDNAILVLSNAVKILRDSADAHHYLGESYLQLKKGNLAVVHLNEAIRLSPNEKAEIHLRLAALYDAAKMKVKATAEYKMFLKKRPDYPEKTQLEKYIAENSPK